MPSKPFTLSASSLSLFKECPRCFWLRFIKGIYRPDTIFPSLPGGMDSVIKIYFDRHRSRGLPPELEGKVQGKLFKDQALLDRWRSRSGGLWYEDKKVGARLMGLLDDCMVDGKKYLPLDYKTRGYPLREDSSSYYQHQLDIYAFLLGKNDCPSANIAYLIYFWPEEVRENGIVQFHVEAKKMSVDPERAYDLFSRAVEVLKGDEPAPSSKCGFCSWAGNIRTAASPSQTPSSKIPRTRKNKSNTKTPQAGFDF